MEEGQTQLYKYWSDYGFGDCGGERGCGAVPDEETFEPRFKERVGVGQGRK